MCAGIHRWLIAERSAEREGFEPSREQSAPYSLSRRVPSATRPPLREMPADVKPGGRRRILEGAQRGWQTPIGERVGRYARPSVDPQAQYDRYEAIFEGIEPPYAFVDLGALESNSQEMLGRAAGKPIRVASKSIRCREVIERVEAADGYSGILAYALAEALMLARAGHRDIVVAYPTADRHSISELAAMVAEDPELIVTLIVDEAAQLDLIEQSVGSGPTPIRVAIDIDVGFSTLRGNVRIGPEALPDPDPGRGAQARRGDRLPARPQARWPARLRGPGRRRRRRNPRKRPPELRHPQDAGGLDERALGAARRDRRRGERGGAAAVRQRRRHRQPRADDEGGRRHRARRRLGLLRARRSSTPTAASR